MIRMVKLKNSFSLLSSQKRFFWRQLMEQFDSPKETEPYTIYSTNSSHIKTWKSYDDRSYRGQSCGQLEILKFSESTDQQQLNTNIVNFKGELIFNEDIAKFNRAKGAFCACKGTFTSVLDLRDYEGFSLKVLSVDQDLSFTFNMYCESQFERDLYQIVLQVPKNEWFTFHIPFYLFKYVASQNIDYISYYYILYYLYEYYY
jgi:hypothetical protein